MENISKLNSKVVKTLSYQLGNASLSFGVDEENQNDVENFLCLLRQAVVDVEKLVK